MKLFITCMQCVQELVNPLPGFSEVEVQDNGCYIMHCSHGHKTTTIVQNPKYEILFDIGANAIVDGYYREAVSSFTSSLERFYEYSIKILCKHNNVSNDTFKKSWKNVSNQSERQLGAFLFLWLQEFQELAELLPEKMIKFRNEVIHKGKIPNKEEAIKYGDAVLVSINAKAKKLNINFKAEINELTFEHIQECSANSTHQQSQGTMSENTILRDFSSTKTLTEHLSYLETKRNMLGTLSGLTNDRGS